MKKLIKNPVWMGLLLLVLSSCASKVSPTAYMKWVEDQDNGMIRSKSIAGVNYELNYYPYEYFCMKKAGVEGLKEERVDSLQYYYLKIGVDESSNAIMARLNNEEEYYGRLKYYSFDIRHDLSLIEGKDTLRCLSADLERTYGMVPEIRILLGFEASKAPKTEDKRIIYYDRVFGNGRLSMTYDKKDLNEIPHIHI